MKDHMCMFSDTDYGQTAGKQIQYFQKVLYFVLIWHLHDFIKY